LVLRATVPQGIHAISLYFVNDDGHLGGNAFRDFLIEAKREPFRDRPEQGTETPMARVKDFWGGVYKQFLVRGPGTFRFTILRNGSMNTICSAIMVDRLTGEFSKVDSMPLAWMGGVQYDPPDLAETDNLPLSVDAWNALDAALQSVQFCLADRRIRLEAYRAASAAEPGCTMALKNWRWRLHLWTPQDSSEFAEKMSVAWESMKEMNPGKL
jgi:hypothetical protein